MNRYKQFLPYSAWAILFFIMFFGLILNINSYTSSLQRENIRLRAEQNRLEDNLSSYRLESDTDIISKIEQQTDTGNIQRINPNEETDVISLIPADTSSSSSISDPSVTSPNPESDPGGLIIR